MHALLLIEGFGLNWGFPNLGVPFRGSLIRIIVSEGLHWGNYDVGLGCRIVFMHANFRLPLPAKSLQQASVLQRSSG